MDKQSDLNISPNKLRANYTLGSKSNKLISIKKSQFKTQESTTESLTVRMVTTPIKDNTQSMSYRIAKLQEELDVEEISIKINRLHDLTESQRLSAETEIYEKYLEGIIFNVVRIDLNLGKSLQRGWKGYKNCVGRKTEIKQNVAEQKIEMREVSSQVSEEMIVARNAWEIENYISTLHRVITGMGQMQIGKIIEKLSELSFSLRPTDLPELSEVGEVQEIDFTDAIKSIHLLLKTRLRPTETHKVDFFASNKEEFTQTYVSLEDFTNTDVYNVLIAEKNAKIGHLKEKLRRNEDLEFLLRQKSKECEDLRKNFVELKTSICHQCRAKRALIENSSLKIRNLQVSVEKGVSIERELEETKAKLVESHQVISESAKKIQELKDSLEDVNGKLDENKAIRERLEKELEESGRGLAEILKKLEKSEKRRKEIEGKLRVELSHIETLKKRMKDVLEENTLLRKGKEKVFSQKVLNTNYKSVEDRQKPLNTSYMSEENKPKVRFNTKTPPPEQVESASFTRSPEKKRVVMRYEFTKLFTERAETAELFDRRIDEMIEGESDTKIDGIRVDRIVSKKQRVIELMNMSKEEYLGLSKRTRVKMFECLYEHKDKCGSDCEHLRRAMMLRLKDRGQVFPTKKYNINLKK